MPIATLIPLLVEILGALPGAVDSVRQIWRLATQTTAPTADEQAQMDAALDAAHRVLQQS